MSPEYKYGGARALVRLHERELRSFLATWKECQARGLKLPASEDPDYADLESLRHHLLRASRGYLAWCCRQLHEIEPVLPPPPRQAEELALNAWIEELLAEWRKHFHEADEEAFYTPAYPSGWDTPYSIDSMLEHAVMHPIRHRYQLENLMARAEDELE